MCASCVKYTKCFNMLFGTIVIKAFIIATWGFIVLPPASSSAMKGNLPSLPVIANFLKTFVKPLMELDNPKFRTIKDAEIEKVIEDKIAQLKPYLQDDEVIHLKEDVTKQVEGENDTTIIEFIPPAQYSSKGHLRNKNELLKIDMKKYEKIKDKITRALNQESISDYTSNLIKTTLDDMIYRVMNNQCSWKSGSEKKSDLRHKKKKIDESVLTIANVWEQLWDVVFKSADKTEKDTIFLRHFHDFVTKVINDTNLLKSNIRFICNAFDEKRDGLVIDHEFKTDKKWYRKTDNSQLLDKPILRDGPGFKEPTSGEASCDNFKVCSQELKNFMCDFYSNLNETAVATLTNYAAMFMRDVNSDGGDEKDTVIRNINKTSDIIEHKISLIFKKQTEKFQLDENKSKNKNMYALKTYIQKSVNHVKKQIMKDLSINLNTLRPKLLLNIQKDIEVNMDVDLGNLERDLTTKICMVFATCNGRFVGRRQKGDGKTGAFIDKNSLYVQIQMTLDENKYKKPDRRIGLNVGQAMKDANHVNLALRSQDGISKSIAPITRTTFKDSKKIANEIHDVTKADDDGKRSQLKVKLAKADSKDHYKTPSLLKPTDAYRPKRNSIYPRLRSGAQIFYRKK